MDKVIHSDMSRQHVESYGRSGATGRDLAKIIDTFYLHVDINDKAIGFWLATQGYWEAWITSWMSKNIKPGMRCIDVGSNWGYYTRVMEFLSGEFGYVYSFEANPNLFNKLKLSVEDYPLEKSAKIEYHNIAVSDKRGIVKLKVPVTNLGGATIMSELEETSEFWNESFTVESNTLDNIVKGHVDLIKMDIEGAEPLAWAGMQKTLENTDLVILEVGSYSPPKFIDELYQKYNVSVVDESGNEKEILRENFYSSGDLVMAVLRRK